MNWRNLFIGALITLVVTIIGGVIVYYATREEPRRTPIESLVYDLDEPAHFKSEKTELFLFSFEVRNVGSATADQVKASVTIPPDVEFIDSNITMTSGAVGSYTSTKPKANVMLITIPALTPLEALKGTVLLNKIPKNKIQIAAKSNNSIATRYDPLKTIQVGTGAKSLASKLSGYALPGAATLQLVLLILLRKSPRFRGFLVRYAPSGRSVNDTGFVFIHSGLLEKARRLFEYNIRRSGGSAYVLVNYGLCLGLLDDPTSDAMLNAADFLGKSRSYRGLCAFNRALVSFHRNDETKGMQQFEEALSLSKSEILYYCEKSQLIRTLAVKNERLRQLIEPLK